jgi:hypothetical protein
MDLEPLYLKWFGNRRSSTWLLGGLCPCHHELLTSVMIMTLPNVKCGGIEFVSLT